jgi:hypothetical protein
LQSLDGGASWSAPVPFGQGRFFEGAFGPQGMVLSFYREFRYRPYGAPAETTGEVDIGAQLGVGSAVGVAPDGRPVFVYGAAVPGLRSRTWNAQGDVHDPATWSAPRLVGYSSYYALATGPRGLWLLYADSDHSGGDPVIARKWAGEKFGRAHRVPRGRLGYANLINLGFAQSPQGEMVAVWYNSPSHRLEYSASKTGSRWTAPRVLATGVELPSRISVALGADGRGLVLYDPNFGGDIHAVPISVRSLLRKR